MNKHIAICFLIAGLVARAFFMKSFLLEDTLSAARVKKEPIPQKVISLINDEEQIMDKNILDYEWVNENIQITTGIIKAPLDGHGFEFIAIKNQHGWSLHNIKIWQS